MMMEEITGRLHALEQQVSYLMSKEKQIQGRLTNFEYHLKGVFKKHDITKTEIIAEILNRVGEALTETSWNDIL